MKCVYFNILSLGRGSNVESRTIMFGNEFLGEGMTRAAEYIGNASNQKLYIELERRLELAQSTGTMAGSEFYRNFKSEEEADKKVSQAPKTKTNKRKVSSSGAKGSIKPAVAAKGKAPIVDKGSLIRS